MRGLVQCGTLALFATLAPVAPLTSQSTTQLVSTGSVVYPYSRTLTFVGEASPAVLIDGSPDFWEIGVDGGVEYTLTPSIDLLAYQFFILNNQIGGLNSFEFRTRLGVIPHWRPRSRWLIQGRVIVETRFIFYEGDTPNDGSARLRIRGLTRYTVHKHSEYTQGAIFLRGDIEAFTPIGPKAEERYFDKFGLRFGVGSRLRQDIVAEIDLVRRASEFTLGDNSDNVDWLIELRFTYVLPRRDEGFTKIQSN